MGLVNCSKCGRLFGTENDDETLCLRCKEDGYESDFKKVREYLYANPGADIEEVAEATEVERARIMRYLREERIEIVDEENALLHCSRCGKSIKTGRYCASCEADVKKELSGALDTMRKLNEKFQKPAATKKTTEIYTRNVADKK